MAQLGARFHGMEEVVSSNLTRSTKTNPNTSKTYRGLIALFLFVEEVARSKARSKHGPKICFPQMLAWYGSDRVSSPPNRTDSVTSWYAW